MIRENFRIKMRRSEKAKIIGNTLNKNSWIMVLHKPDNVTDVTNDIDGSEVGT